MIVALDGDFRTSCETQLQQGIDSYIVGYLVDDDVNVKMILVIVGSTGIITRPLTKYHSNSSRKHEIK